MKKKMLILAVTLMMVFGTVIPALAQGVDTTGTFNLAGGSLNVAPSAITFTGDAINGLTATIASGSTDPWTVTDPTGTGAGWHMTVVATIPTVGGHTIPLDGLEMSLLNEDIVWVAGHATLPVSADNVNPIALSSSATLVSALADTAMGTYTIQPTFTLVVPAKTYAGIYNTTITVTMLSTP